MDRFGLSLALLIRTLRMLTSGLLQKACSLKNSVTFAMLEIKSKLFELRAIEMQVHDYDTQSDGPAW